MTTTIRNYSAARNPRGNCTFCLQEFSQRTIARHLECCKSRKQSMMAPDSTVNIDLESNIFHIGAKAENGISKYWIHIGVASNSKLSDIDAFLRDIWVECCGHLSQFTINNLSYNSSPDPECDEIGMDVPLYSVLTDGIELAYEYDFGTTTEVLLKVYSTWWGRFKNSSKDRVMIFARNNAPQITCTKCGRKEATRVCAFCIYEHFEEAWVCEECAKEHKCDKRALHRVVNSPRVGLCGYARSTSPA